MENTIHRAGVNLPHAPQVPTTSYRCQGMSLGRDDNKTVSGSFEFALTSLPSGWAGGFGRSGGGIVLPEAPGGTSVTPGAG